MKTEQIYQIVQVANMGSINKAAQTLFMAQSSLSASIKSVESEVGKEIFIRSQRKIRLTEFGYAFLEEATQMLEHYNRILEISGKEQSYEKKQFNVSVYYLLFANYAFSQLCNKYKNFTINFGYWERSRMEIITDVASNNSELGILMMPSIRNEQWKSLISAYGLEYFKLTTEPLYLLFGPKSSLYNSKLTEINKDFIKEHTLVILEEDNELFCRINKEMLAIFHPKSYVSIRDRGSISSMLQNQEIYFVATTNVNAYANTNFYADVKSLPLVGDDLFNFEIGCIKRYGEPYSPLAKEYLEILNDIIG